MPSVYPMTDIEILVFDGVDELDAVAPFEILVAAGYHVELTPTGVLGRPDLLVVTGGRWTSKAPASAWGEVQRGVIPSATHRAAIDDLREFGVDVRHEARVVDDGDVLTSGGVTSGIDLALHLIEVDRGRDAALGEAARIEHDLRGPVLRTRATG